MGLLKKHWHYTAMAVILVSIAMFAFSKDKPSFGLNKIYADATTTAGDVSILGNLTISGSSSASKLHLFEKGPNNYMITSNVDQNGNKDAGLGGWQYTAPYTNWINFEPLVLKLVNSENGFYINNMIQLNPVRTEFGPPGGSGPDQDKRIGPSNERYEGMPNPINPEEGGANPATGVNQVYQLLLKSVNGISGDWSRVVPVCVNSTVPGRVEQCNPTHTRAIGTTQENVPPGGNTFFDTMGIVRNVICKGSSRPGDLLALGKGNYSGYLVANNNAPSADVVGVGLSNCTDLSGSGGVVDIILGAKSLATATSTSNNTQSNGHVVSSGLTPVISACGTSSAIVGTDSAGKITIGSNVTQCTITFDKPFPRSPACTANNETNTNQSRRATAVSNSNGVTIIAGDRFQGGDVISYVCIGY